MFKGNVLVLVTAVKGDKTTLYVTISSEALRNCKM